MSHDGIEGFVLDSSLIKSNYSRDGSAPMLCEVCVQIRMCRPEPILDLELWYSCSCDLHKIARTEPIDTKKKWEKENGTTTTE